MLKEDITEIEDPVKQDIINRFKLHVQNVDICLTDYTSTHCGKEGHWLETKMGLTHNYLHFYVILLLSFYYL